MMNGLGKIADTKTGNAAKDKVNGTNAKGKMLSNIIFTKIIYIYF